jgi:hypothetical protein
MPTAIILDAVTGRNGGLGSEESKNYTCGAAGKSAHAASDTGAHDAVLLSKM